MALFRRATYAASVATPRDPYPQSGAEIAFAGRSNAGKSSAINALAGQRRLAFVSKTPGRTRMINFFALDGDRFLVDLPGYGFASVPGEIRSQWHRLLEEYLKHREALKGIALIMDVRHPFTERDMQLIDYFRQTAKPIHVLLTKADKLSQTQANVALREAAKRLSQLSPLYSVQLFSSLKRTGLDEAETRFAQWLGGKPAPLEGSRHKQRPRVISVTRGRNKKPPG